MQETILQKEITQEKAVQETTTQERKTSEALGNIRTAMLFFLIDIYILGFDIVPDFVGWMSMLGAVAMLTGKVKGIERIRTFGQVMLGYEVAMVVLNYIGGMLPFYDLIMGYVGIFILCIRMYFMYIILHGRGRRGKDDTGHLPQPKPCASGRADASSLRRGAGDGEHRRLGNSALWRLCGVLSRVHRVSLLFEGGGAEAGEKADRNNRNGINKSLHYGGLF